MIIVISPAKKLDMEVDASAVKKISKPLFLDQSSELVSGLRKFRSQDIKSLMGVSDKIADLNRERYQEWKVPFNKSNAKPAILAFQGDVYQGMDAASFSEREMKFAQDHLRILSGLYGSLRPLDLMQAYRLEMGTSLKNTKGKNLYDFWRDDLTSYVNRELSKNKSEYLINLASNEYFSALDAKAINAEIVTPVFKEYKNGTYKVISFLAKKARGMMCAHIISNEITSLDGIKKFNRDGYKFSKKDSTDNQLVFLRKQ